MTTPKQRIQAILDIVRACPAAQVATIRADGHPETRDMANMMNHNATQLDLWFMTGRGTPKVAQLNRNNKCSLYYYDAATHYAVRLFGTMELVDDNKTRHEHWMPEFTRFGYSGPDDPEFVLLHFCAAEYKYYDANGLQTGNLK